MVARWKGGSVALALLLIALCGSLLGQTQTLSKESKASIVREAGRHLAERYVLSDVGALCAHHLDSLLSSGALDTVENRQEYARILTEALYSVSRDKHMRVRLRPGGETARADSDPLVEEYRRQRSMSEGNFGFAKAEVLEGNVGYLDIRWFPPVEAARPTASAAMRFVEHADALIIDLRRNGGGNPETIQYICSYFFAEKTHLNSLHWREGNRTEEFWTLDSVEGAKMPTVPLFVLTSGRTFSGGEEFAYNLKTRRRAMLIGEVTGGGANPGGMFPLPDGFAIFVPMGRAINPVTGTNWEGAGVEPDVRCDKDSALTIGVRKAVDAARARRDSSMAAVEESAKTIRDALGKAELLYAEERRGEGDALVFLALAEALGQGFLDEIPINELGYRALRQGKVDAAIGIFKFNLGQFPASWNAYDSLAEAYMTKGETDKAIMYYKKSLELNPANEGARANIKKMGGKI